VGRADRRQQRPGRRLAGAWLADKTVYYYLHLALCGPGIALLWRALFSPFGYVLRAGRDSPCAPRRSASICAASNGPPSCWPDLRGTGRRRLRLFQGQHLALVGLDRASTDGLVMVLLGGVETLTGPVVGAAIFTWLRDALARETEFWRAALGW
jgi:branched-chain amino acid transport system permease protein